MIRIEDLALSILTKTTVIPEFKSKDGDLNEFLMQEAKDYQEQLLAVTYLLQNPKTGEVVAYNNPILMPRYLHIPHTPDTARTLTLSGRNCLAVSCMTTPP